MTRFLLTFLCAHFAACSTAFAQFGSSSLSGLGHLGTRLRPTINALEVPIGGYTPFVGLGLTDEFKNENADTFFLADLSLAPGGSWLGNGEDHFEVALLDTGASVSLITLEASLAFDLSGHGFDGTEPLPIGGATGLLQATVTDPLGVYVTGLANRNTTATALALDTSNMVGLTSMAIAEAPPEWTLPSVVGLPVASQFTTVISADQPQIFRHDGRTVRTPQVEFLPLGSGGQGLVRRAPLTLKNSTGFNTPPQYIYNVFNILNGDPLTDNPLAPTIIGQADAGLFLTVDIANDGNSKQSQLFLFDTGASVSAVSEVMAAELGFDPVLDAPDFEVQVEGSGGTIESVPGFYADELKISTVGGSFVLQNVPLVVLDITDPSNIGNVLPGLIGTNLFTDRNVIINPIPSAGGGGVGPSLYISDPVTVEREWVPANGGIDWHDPANWSANEVPGPLWVADVRSGDFQNSTARISSDSQVHRLYLAAGQESSMDLTIDEGATLWVFGGVTVERGGTLRLAEGTLDSQFVDLREGAMLSGRGVVRAEFENREGVIQPAGELVIEGIFANRDEGTLAIEIGGTTPVDEYGVLTIDGNAFLGGTLEVALTNTGHGMFRPRVGDEFEILTTIGDGEVLGTFDELLLPVSLVWDIEYLSDSVLLHVLENLEIPGDFNGNGQVEQSDLDLVLLNWGAIANDLNAPSWISDLPSGNVDQDELDRVLLNWGNAAAGSALISASGGVPEPASVVLILAAAVCCGMCSSIRRALTGKPPKTQPGRPAPLA